MLGPNHHSYDLGKQAYGDRLTHAARIRQIQQDRHDTARPFDRESHRLITVRRLAAGVVAVVLTVTVAAATVTSTAAAPNAASGGGPALIR